MHIAVKLLRFAVEKLRSNIPEYPEQLEGRKPTLMDWFVRASIYPEIGVLTAEEYSRWFNVVCADERVYRIYLGTVKWMYESHKASAETWKNLMETTQKAKTLHDEAVQQLEKELKKAAARKKRS